MSIRNSMRHTGAVIGIATAGIGVGEAINVNPALANYVGAEVACPQPEQIGVKPSIAGNIAVNQMLARNHGEGTYSLVAGPTGAVLNGKRLEEGEPIISTTPFTTPTLDARPGARGTVSVEFSKSVDSVVAEDARLVVGPVTTAPKSERVQGIEPVTVDLNCVTKVPAPVVPEQPKQPQQPTPEQPLVCPVQPAEMKVGLKGTRRLQALGKYGTLTAIFKNTSATETIDGTNNGILKGKNARPDTSAKGIVELGDDLYVIGGLPEGVSLKNGHLVYDVGGKRGDLEPGELEKVTIKVGSTGDGRGVNTIRARSFGSSETKDPNDPKRACSRAAAKAAMNVLVIPRPPVKRPQPVTG